VWPGHANYAKNNRRSAWLWRSPSAGGTRAMCGRLEAMLEQARVKIKRNGANTRQMTKSESGIRQTCPVITITITIELSSRKRHGLFLFLVYFVKLSLLLLPLPLSLLLLSSSEQSTMLLLSLSLSLSLNQCLSMFIYLFLISLSFLRTTFYDPSN